MCLPAVPELKQLSYFSLLGLLMVMCGECLRKAAMLTAGSNFNHIVQNEKAQSHVLVTDGVYSMFRHPSYVGWFYWSIGTQVSPSGLHEALHNARRTSFEPGRAAGLSSGSEEKILPELLGCVI